MRTTLWDLLQFVLAAATAGFFIAACMIEGDDQFGEGAVAAFVSLAILALVTD